MARFLLLLSFLLVTSAFTVSVADSSAEVYWRSVFPKSPIPSALRDAIFSDKGLAKSVPAASTDSVVYTPFLEKSLRLGSKMALYFKRDVAGVSFLPQQVADSIPFSSSKLPEILSRLSIDPSSEDASSIKSTLVECEARALPGQVKLCATSLESMVNFAMSGLKSGNIKILSTSIAKTAEAKQDYTITGFNKVNTDEFVACHAEAYAYAVYRCHTITIKAYTVSLVGADRTKVQALAACHLYSGLGGGAEVMSYIEAASKKFGVDPKAVPICHFLPQEDLLWARA